MRLTPHEDFNKIREMLDQWAKNAGEGVTYEFSQVRF